MGPKRLVLVLVHNRRAAKKSSGAGNADSRMQKQRLEFGYYWRRLFWELAKLTSQFLDKQLPRHLRVLQGCRDTKINVMQNLIKRKECTRAEEK